MDPAVPIDPPAASQQRSTADVGLELPPPRTRLELARLLAGSTVEGIAHRRTFSEVERFFFMLGYTRSGSTLVGTLLNAHPQMVIAHEADVFRFVRPGVTRSTLFAILLRRDREFAAIDRSYHGFAYSVPGSDQGSFTSLRVVGDKHAGRATRRLHADPALLERVRARVRVPIRVLHLVRNPFDNIASIARNRDLPLSSAMEIYGRLGVAVDEVSARLDPSELLAVRYEHVVADPVGTLRELCAFVGVDATPGYLTACAALISGDTRRSRDRVAWAPQQIAAVEDLIGSRAALDGYSFGG